MFTAKDLEVYKDALKEKKNRATKTGEKPLKTPPPPPSATKTPKPPLKLQHEEPNKERKPLSVVHKASNTFKDQHKPPSPAPVGSSKHADLVKKPKESATLKTPSPAGKLRTTEADSFVKAPELRNESLRSSRETLLLKPPSIKPEENKVAGVRKSKEPSTHGANGVYQKSPSLSVAKAAPAVDANASLCSECTRAASEGAVCFIGNDGRVSACTTRSAVRLCKNLNCAANNPEYVAAMANAPKKYLISKRHLLKAQYGLKSRSSRPKSPNLQQIDAGSDALSPSNSEMSSVNVDMNSKSCALGSDDGEFSPFANGDLRLFDGDLSLFDANMGFSERDMGFLNDGVTGMEDYATSKHGIAGELVGNGAAFGEQNDFSFLEGEAGETESPKISTLERAKEHIDAHSEGDWCGDNDLCTIKLSDSEELDDGGTIGSPMHGGGSAEESLTNCNDTLSPNGTGEQVDDGDDQSVNALAPIDMCQVGDDDQKVEVVPTTNGNGRALADDQVGDITPAIGIKQVEEDNWLDNIAPTTDVDLVVHDEQSGGITLIADTEQVTDDEQIGEIVNGDVRSGLMPGETTNQVADDKKGNDLTLAVDEHVVLDDQSDVNDEDHERSGEGTSLTNTHVAGDDETSLNGTQVVDDAKSGVITSLSDIHAADVHGSDIAVLHDTHVAADGDQKADITPLNDGHVAVENCGDDMESPHGRYEGDDDQTDGITSLLDRHELDDDESDEDENEDDEPDEIAGDTCIAEEDSLTDSRERMENALNGNDSGGQDGSVTSSMKKGSKQRRRRVLGVVEEANPETVTLRKQQTKEREQREEWMPNYAIEGVVHKLAPTGEAKVKVLVEAFESIISHTDGEGIDASKQKQTLT
eukprot:c22691_g1_i1 orf=134-2743(-)